MRSLLFLLVLAPLGCVNDPGPGDTSSGTSATNQTNDEKLAAEVEQRSSAREVTGPALTERAPLPTADGVTGEVPEEFLVTLKQDLADRLSAGNANITVAVAESVIWNDGSLGCPKPGEMYTQATVPGYRVVLELAGQRYTYHANTDGYFVPCDFQVMMPPPGETPTQ